jgi:hypothetical protein
MNRTYYPQARATMALLPFDKSIETIEEGLIRIPDILPARIKIESNDIKTADKFEIEIDERYFPADPRLFRSVTLDMHIADVGAADRYLQPSDTTRVGLGIADELGKKFGNDGTLVSMSGRDYKGLLLDEKWQGRSVALDRPIDVILREILDSTPATEPMKLRLDVASAPIVPGGKGRKRKTFRAKADATIFEGMFQLCLKVGLVCTVRFDSVVIQAPRTFDSTRDLIPYFVTAENLTSLEITRKFGVRDLPNIRVSAIDHENNQTISGSYPPNPRDALRVVKTSRGSKKKTQTIINEFVIRHPAPTVAILENIAAQIHARYAQQQVSVSFSTNDMTVRRYNAERRIQGEGDVISMTDVLNGSPVKILISKASRQILEANITPDGKRRALLLKGYTRQVAEVLSRGWRAIDTPFFVDMATHEYDPDNGYKFTGKASAFLTVDLETL